ncbi:hypothetical protein QCA50_006406 [Cerrena zonata]|uniref:Uncharacterized protein n=1 Tax=Cerrena zonata TaxID=2478898 RepID=A0AAW0GBD1_9APHY
MFASTLLKLFTVVIAASVVALAIPTTNEKRGTTVDEFDSLYWKLVSDDQYLAITSTSMLIYQHRAAIDGLQENDGASKRDLIVDGYTVM